MTSIPRNRTDYMAALRRALAEQDPPVSLDIAANAVSRYEKRFADGVAAGVSEADIAASLGDPSQIAATLSSGAEPEPPVQSSYFSPPGEPPPAKQPSPASTAKSIQFRKNPADVLRVILSAIGLAIFNLFMVVPAAVYAALLSAAYATSLGFYIAGIAITASGLSGANELVLNGPLRHIVSELDRDLQRELTGTARHPVQTKITINESGINMFKEPVRVKGSVTINGEDNSDAARQDAGGKVDVLEKAEHLAGRGIHISTDDDDQARSTQTAFGISMVLGAIVLFLLCLVVTRYTFIGIKRYAQMNLSLLKGH